MEGLAKTRRAITATTPPLLDKSEESNFQVVDDGRELDFRTDGAPDDGIPSLALGSRAVFNQEMVATGRRAFTCELLAKHGPLT